MTSASTSDTHTLRQEPRPGPAGSTLAPRDQRLTRFLTRPRLGLWTVLIGVGLTAPCLVTGFHLDDLIGRFIFSDLPGAERLFHIYAGGYGAANGNPVDAAWMIEEGYAPWWMNPELLLQFYRPISLWTHLLDAELWPSSAFLWHAHSLVWFGFMLYAAVLCYRSLQGPLIGALGGLLYAVDHTHALAVGFITNRYVMIATGFSLLALRDHHRHRQGGSRPAGWLAPLWYGLALLSGEYSAAIFGYLLAYALFLESGSWLRRGLSLVPYFVTTLAWRVLYNALGRGARHSDLYIDPMREPFSFAVAVFERAPLLLLGQWGLPPAEYAGTFGPAIEVGLTVFAWLFAVGLAVALWPLLKRDALSRFWTMGMLLALIPVCSAEPHNRMLFVASIGACGLMAQWWHVCAYELRGALRSRLLKYSFGFGVYMVWWHLLISPLGVPIQAGSFVLLEPLKTAFADVGSEAVGREAVFVTSPDYFSVRLMRMTKEVEGQPTPLRWRTLGFGPEQVTLERSDDRTLILNYAGGVMSESVLTKPALDLYRSRKTPMAPGYTVPLVGLTIELLEVTDDGRPLRARFRFEESLDAPRYRFYYWSDNHYHVLDVPAVGATRVLPRAILTPELPGEDTPRQQAAQPTAASSCEHMTADLTTG